MGLGFMKEGQHWKRRYEISIRYIPNMRDENEETRALILQLGYKENIWSVLSDYGTWVLDEKKCFNDEYKQRIKIDRIVTMWWKELGKMEGVAKK